MCVYIHIHTQFRGHLEIWEEFLHRSWCSPSLNLFFGKFLQRFLVLVVALKFVLRFFKPVRLWVFYMNFNHPAKHSLKLAMRLVAIKDFRNSITTIPFFQVVFLLQYVVFGHSLVPPDTCF